MSAFFLISMAASPFYDCKALRSAARRGLLRTLILLWIAPFVVGASAQEEEASLHVPANEQTELRILTPTMLEAYLVNTQGAGGEDRPVPWDWVEEKSGGSKMRRFPSPQKSKCPRTAKSCPLRVSVSAESQFSRRSPTKCAGKRAICALGIHFSWSLMDPIPEGARLELTYTNSSPQWPATLRFSAFFKPTRENLLFHVNQNGLRTGLAEASANRLLLRDAR